MKKIILILSLAISFSAFAQKDSTFKHHIYNVSINIGGGIPVGDFGKATNSASTSGTNVNQLTSMGAYGYYTTGGFALPGISLNISGAITLPANNYHSGLMVLQGYNVNGIDLQKLADYSNSNFIQKNFPYPPNPKPLYTVNNSGNYTEYRGLFGAFYTIIPVSSISIDFRALAGMVICKSPELIFDYDQVSTAYYFDKDIMASSTLSIGYDFGIEIKFRATKKMIFQVSADYFYTEPTYTITNAFLFNLTAGNLFYQNIGSVVVPISIVNLSLGLDYRFGK